MRLLVKELKGKTFRLIDVETGDEYRAFARDFKDIDFLIGTLFIVNNEETSGNLLMSFTLIEEIIGDSSKGRVEIDTSEVKIGDLIDGVPVFSLGKVYAKAGKKMAYAYFR